MNNPIELFIAAMQIITNEYVRFGLVILAMVVGYVLFGCNRKTPEGTFLWTLVPAVLTDGILLFIKWFYTRQLGPPLEINTVLRLVDAHYQAFWAIVIAVVVLVFAIPLYGIWVILIGMLKKQRGG